MQSSFVVHAHMPVLEENAVLSLLRVVDALSKHIEASDYLNSAYYAAKWSATGQVSLGAGSCSELRTRLDPNACRNAVSAVATSHIPGIAAARGPANSVNYTIEVHQRPPRWADEGEEHLFPTVLLRIDSLEPFLSCKSAPFLNAADEEVRERNCEALAEGLVEFAKATSVRKLCVFEGDASPLPLNSHLSYYANAAAVLDDFHLIKRVRQFGLGKNGIETIPLKDYDDAQHSRLLSEYRKPEWRMALWKRLGAVVMHATDVRISDLERVLTSGHFDYFGDRLNVASGFCVLDYPFFLDKWLDDFYLKVLENVADEGKTNC